MAFFKMGLFTFGGGLAMLPLIQRTVVEDKKWMTADEMVDCVAVCQSMPGVIAINAATYIGNRKKGAAGAFAATLGVILPSFVIIILAVLFLGAIGDNKYVEGVFTGIKAASCGLILYSAWKLGKQVLKRKWEWLIAVIAFVMIIGFGVTALWAILMGAAAGLCAAGWRRKKRGQCRERQSGTREAEEPAATEAPAETETPAGPREGGGGAL